MINLNLLGMDIHLCGSEVNHRPRKSGLVPVANFNPLSFYQSFSIDSDKVVFCGLCLKSIFSDFKTEYTVAKVL